MSRRAVVGLEIHARLATRTKLFCACPNAYGLPPNTAVCPVCLGLPGSLPRPGTAAVDLGVRLAVALDADVAGLSVFERKAYGYPDQPRNYQITQQARPLARGGAIEIGPVVAPQRVPLARLHLEEDAGRSLHDAGVSRIDLNRAGTPLIEVVTEPALHDGAGAAAVVRELQRLLRWLGVGDASLEQGGLRCDANVSLSGDDGADGPRVELKNVNTLRGVARAVDAEIARQRALVADGGRVVATTRGWDARADASFHQRGKEGRDDYRCFPDPDLPPVAVQPAAVAAARRELPELPRARELRCQRSRGLSPDRAALMCSSRGRADCFEAVADALGDPKLAADWLAGEGSAAASARGVELDALPVPPAEIAALLRRLADGAINRPTAQAAFAEMLASGRTAAEVVGSGDRAVIADPAALRPFVAAVLRDHPEAVAAWRGGRAGALEFLVGSVMRATGGRAAPATARTMLERALREGAAPDGTSADA